MEFVLCMLIVITVLIGFSEKDSKSARKYWDDEDQEKK